MTLLEAALRRVDEDLRKRGARFALVGGLAVRSADDLDRARSSLALIRERGYHRDRDLQRALDELLEG